MRERGHGLDIANAMRNFLQRTRWIFFGLVFLSMALILILSVKQDISRDIIFLRNHVPFGASFDQGRNYSLARKRLHRACTELAYIGKVNYYGRKKRQIFTSKKHNLAVCVVPKSGCTFMKQLVYYLNDPHDLVTSHFAESFKSNESYIRTIEGIRKSIFDIPRMIVHHDIDFQPLQISLNEFAEKEGLKVVLARNPYSRLYSAYIDKFFIPARWPLQIAAYKHKFLHQRHRNTRTVFNICKAKLETFQDFLETVLLMGEHSSYDIHWGPISTLCDPCLVKPDIVIKQESYHEDVQYMLQKLDVNYEQLETINKAIAKQGVQTDVYLRGLIKTMYSKGIEGPSDKCFTRVEMAYRVWKALKIQGQLYQAIDFPYSKFFDHPDFDADVVADIILAEMRSMPISPEESQMQRQRALARAYRNIRPEILIQIQGLYYHDFRMFGYDFNPPKFQE